MTAIQESTGADEGGVLFIEDEFEVLDPIVRRLNRKNVASEIADYETAPTALTKRPFRKVVFDQLFAAGQLGTQLYAALRRGDYGPVNMRVECAFYTALSRLEVAGHLSTVDDGPEARILLKGDGLIPLYEFLEIDEKVVRPSSRARTLVEVVQLEDQGKVVTLLVPGWRSDLTVRVPVRRLPVAITRELHAGAVAGRLYTAVADLAADDVSELALDEFDVLRES